MVAKWEIILFWKSAYRQLDLLKGGLYNRSTRYIVTNVELFKPNGINQIKTNGLDQN